MWERAWEREESAAELGLRPKPWPPALDLVSCFPGQLLKGHREEGCGGGGKEEAGKHSEQTLGKSFNGEKES